MDEQFKLPVLHNGKQYMLPAALKVTGYTYRFEVEVNGQCIFFEPDEEKNYRAMQKNIDSKDVRPVDTDFLRAICLFIESFLKDV